MKTKLVYILTCSPDDNFIEQALLSIYTARYYNATALIILIVDDLTNKLLVGRRAEILEYISEKLVVDLPDDMNMINRSRWLKTSFRKLISGDLLFIDCDTIITSSLNEIDNCSSEIAAVLDSHLPLNKYLVSIFDHVRKRAEIVGWDVTKEKYYFNSGVIYVKDTEGNSRFFEDWHSCWIKGIKSQIIADQPYFALANIKSGRPVQRLDDVWNCIMYTQPLFVDHAKIMHFSSFKNMSYLFGNSFLRKVRNDGVQNNDFIKYSILNPLLSFVPFDNLIYQFNVKGCWKFIHKITKTSKLISIHLNKNYEPYLNTSFAGNFSKILFSKNLFWIGSFMFTMYKLYSVKINRNYKFVANVCSV